MSYGDTDLFLEIDSREYKGLTYAYSLLPSPIALTDSNDEWLFLNKAALDLLGIASITEAAGFSTTINWGGRLKPAESTDPAEVPSNGQRYFIDVKTSRVFLRHTSQLQMSGVGVARLERLYDVTIIYENNHRAQTMVDAAPICCNYWNDKLENIDCNLEAPKLFDLPDKKAYLDKFFELSPDLQPNGRKSVEEVARHVNKAFQKGFDQFEWMHQKLNGEMIPAEITLVRMSKDSGDVVLGYIRDLRSSRQVANVGFIRVLRGWS